MKYGYIGLCINEYTGLELQCGTTANPSGACVPSKDTYLGETTMATFGYDRYTVGYCAGCMIVYIAVCRITSYLALRFLKM